MKIPVQISLVALLWLITINSGELGSLDVDLRLQMAHAWWTGTEEVQITSDMQPKVRGDIRFGVIGADGERYIAYETGQSFLMLPADWLGSQLHQFWSAVPAETLRKWSVNLLTFIPINIAVILAAFWLLRLLNFEERVAGLASLTLLLGTTALHYAQVHQHNNQLLLLTTLGYATAIAYVRTRQSFWPLLGGIALGVAVFIRVTSVIHALTVVLFLVGAIAYKHRQVRPVMQSVGLWLIGFVPVFMVSRYIDFLRYGSLFASGKGVEKLQLTTDIMWQGLPQLPDGYPLINAPHVGILGPLISPAKSLFLYDPLLLPCLMLGVLCWRNLSPWIRWYFVTSTLNLGLHLAAYSRFVFWHGDSAWGARYHVTSVHLLLIPLLALFAQQLFAAHKIRGLILKGILVLSVMIQLASVAMPMNLEIFQRNVGFPGTRLDFRLANRVVNIACRVDRDLIRLCVDRNPDKKQYVEHLNHLNFFPFVYSEDKTESSPEGIDVVQFLLFALWIVALIATVLISWRILSSGYLKSL